MTTKKATKAKSKSSSNKKPPAPPEAVETEAASNGDFQPYDAEAWAWMASPDSIPGALSPILYIGTEVSTGISKLLGRSMTLDEAQYLVQADGDRVVCASESTEFQPVKYVPFVPKGLEKHITAGRELTEIALPYGGAFYVNKEQEPVGYSGSVFNYNSRRQDYEWCRTSPLVIAAEVVRSLTGRMQWGVPFEIASRMMESRQENRERRLRIEKQAENFLIVKKKKNFTRVSDALDEAGREGKKRGKDKRRHRGDEANEE